MLNQIGRMLRCGAHDDVIVQPRHENARRSATPSVYETGQQYTHQQLLGFAVRKAYVAETRIPLLLELSKISTNLQAQNRLRYQATAEISKLLRDEDSLPMFGGVWQANHFASYAVDLMLHEMDNNFSTALEEQLRQTLNLWINELAPAQSEFNLDGIIKTRAEVQDMLNNPAFFSRTKASAPTSDSLQKIESNMKNNDVQNVHKAEVRRFSAVTVSKLEKSFTAAQSKTAQETFTAIQNTINTSAFNSDSKVAMLAGLNIIFNNQATDQYWEHRYSPAQLIPIVWSYIESRESPQLKLDLKESLPVRLAEVSREKPCPVGQLQRLADVPSGLDSEMSNDAENAAFKEELNRIAGSVNQRLGRLLAEDEEYALSKQQVQLNSTISQLGKDMFQQKSFQEIERYRGFNIEPLSAELKKIEIGFEV